MSPSDKQIARSIMDAIQLEMVEQVRARVIKQADQAAALKNLADMADLRGRLDAERRDRGRSFSGAGTAECPDGEINQAAEKLGLDPVFLRAVLCEAIGALSYPNMDSYHLEQLCRRSAPAGRKS